MVCSAGGMVFGGFLASDPARCERSSAPASAWPPDSRCAGDRLQRRCRRWVVPVLFGVMGFASGMAGPSRDLLVKRSTPENASGRVYGVVYSGLDIGQASRRWFSAR
jgi:FSR family fosmidomycin resistance protein-like MFS transporter